MDRIESGTEVIAEDLEHVRAYFAEEGLLRRLLSKLLGGSGKRATRTKKEKELD